MAEDAPAARRRPWLLSFVCLLAVAGLVAMPVLAGKPWFFFCALAARCKASAASDSARTTSTCWQI